MQIFVARCPSDAKQGCRLIEIRFYAPLDTKTGHFGAILPSESLGIVLKKLNLNELRDSFFNTYQNLTGRV